MLALKHLHQLHIVHADIKLENIMIANVLFLIFRGLSNWLILDWLIGLEKKKGINRLMGPWSICLPSMLKERIVEPIGMFGPLAYWHIRWRLASIPLMGSRKMKNGLNWSRYFHLNSEFSRHLHQRT